VQTSGVNVQLNGGTGSGLVHFVVGNNGVIRRTGDRGQSWQSQNNPNPSNLHGVWQKPGFALIVAVGDDGTILQSTNSGGTWIDRSVPIVDDFFEVWGTGPTDVIAVGTGGVVYHFDGANWSPVARPTSSQTLYGIFGDNLGTGELFAVANGGAIYRSTSNAMASWTQTFSTGSTLFSVWGSSINNIYFVGNNGRIFRSTDHGMTVNNVYMMSGPTLHGVWGSRADNIFAVGSGGLILHGQ
jgi:photosystem II stability/assembly factor-like uncharacterized protein